MTSFNIHSPISQHPAFANWQMACEQLNGNRRSAPGAADEPEAMCEI
jgi:hypothetical protein